MKDDKYVVFKKEQWDRASAVGGDILRDLMMPLDDATVIRAGDAFAPGVLWSYVHAVQVALDILEEAPGTGTQMMDHLTSVRDYFAERARQADDASRKLPD